MLKMRLEGGEVGEDEESIGGAIEVRQAERSVCPSVGLAALVLQWAERERPRLGEYGPRHLDQWPPLHEHVAMLRVCAPLTSLTLQPTVPTIPTISQSPEAASLREEERRRRRHYSVHVYRLTEDGRTEEMMSGPGGGQQPDQEDLPVASRWALPARDFEGLWESLVLEPDTKERSLRFALAALRLSQRGLDPHIVAVNRVLLFHGPPGTGKTTLCKALAQKVSIRLCRPAHFFEINSHSLFSKWFAESGRLVMKLFGGIVDVAEGGDSLVFVLIDEIESLAHERTASNSEPSDAIRVVNAVLTQLDRIREYTNVLILTTSNMTEAIDAAFTDRADIKQYIGPPGVPAVYKIYLSCIRELIRVQVIAPPEWLFDFDVLEMGGFEINESTACSLKLLELAKISDGFSGRTLRKIPFLAFATCSNEESVNFDTFMQYMRSTILKQKADGEAFSANFKKLKI